MDRDRKEAGFVGLGLMGAPMAANLLKAGWAVRAWNRSPAALEEFEALGGARVTGVEELRDTPVIIFMLPDLSYIEDAAGERFQALTAQPALRRFAAIGAPIRPRPTKPASFRSLFMLPHFVVANLCWPIVEICSIS